MNLEQEIRRLELIKMELDAMIITFRMMKETDNKDIKNLLKNNTIRNINRLYELGIDYKLQVECLELAKNDDKNIFEIVSDILCKCSNTKEDIFK